VLALINGPRRTHWRFTLLGERQRDDDVDDRLYELASVAEAWISDVLDGGGDARPLVWPFDELLDGERVRVAVEDLMERELPRALLLESPNLRTVVRLWDATGLAARSL
jgi:hypothetical protein